MRIKRNMHPPPPRTIHALRKVSLVLTPLQLETFWGDKLPQVSIGRDLGALKGSSYLLIMTYLVCHRTGAPSLLPSEGGGLI